MNKTDRSMWLKAVRESLGYNQREMSEALGIQQSTYSAMEIGLKSNLSIDHMHTLVSRFGVNPQFLLEGREPMYDADKPSSKALIAAGCYLVPISAQAGYLDELSEQEKRTLPKVVIPGFEGVNSMFFEVEGDSMYPVVQEGDLVACSRVFEVKDIKNGLIYVIVSRSDGILIKYILPKKSSLRCIPHDQINYKVVDIDLADVKELWEVQLKITKDITNQGYQTHSIGSKSRVDRLEALVAKLAEKGGFQP